MMTTLTFDEDVALLLEQTRETQGRRRLEEIINEALRRGLPQLLSARRSAGVDRGYSTPSVSVGRCLIDNVDDVAAVLAASEDDAFP